MFREYSDTKNWGYTISNMKVNIVLNADSIRKAANLNTIDDTKKFVDGMDDEKLWWESKNIAKNLYFGEMERLYNETIKTTQDIHDFLDGIEGIEYFAYELHDFNNIDEYLHSEAAKHDVAIYFNLHYDTISKSFFVIVDMDEGALPRQDIDNISLYVHNILCWIIFKDTEKMYQIAYIND